MRRARESYFDRDHDDADDVMRDETSDLPTYHSDYGRHLMCVRAVDVTLPDLVRDNMVQ
jgi:hypothetical protein